MLKPAIDKRNKKFGDKGDMGHVFHSTSLIGDPDFLELQNYIGATSHNLLGEMGFDMSGHQLFTTEMWVQEFAKKGGWTSYFTHPLEWSYIRFLFFKSR